VEYLNNACGTDTGAYITCLEQVIFRSQQDASCLTQKTTRETSCGSVDNQGVDVYMSCLRNDSGAYSTGAYWDRTTEKLTREVANGRAIVDNCVAKAVAAGAIPFDEGLDTGLPPSSPEDNVDPYDQLDWTEVDVDTTTTALCENLGATVREKCRACGPSKVWTAIGCIPTDMSELAADLVSFLLGVAGLFFLGQVLYGAFKMIVSRGDPRGVQEARERITNSVIALLFIIFSVTILRFIGVNIFNLPGFFSG
jgi:hypothetical protein